MRLRRALAGAALMLGLLFAGFLIGLAIGWSDDSPGPEKGATVTVETTVPGPERTVERTVPGPERTVERTVEKTVTEPCETTLPETGGPGE